MQEDYFLEEHLWNLHCWNKKEQWKWLSWSVNLFSAIFDFYTIQINIVNNKYSIENNRFSILLKSNRQYNRQSINNETDSRKSWTSKYIESFSECVHYSRGGNLSISERQQNHHDTMKPLHRCWWQLLETKFCHQHHCHKTIIRRRPIIIRSGTYPITPSEWVYPDDNSWIMIQEPILLFTLTS